MIIFALVYFFSKSETYSLSFTPNGKTIKISSEKFIFITDSTSFYKTVDFLIADFQNSDSIVFKELISKNLDLNNLDTIICRYILPSKKEKLARGDFDDFMDQIVIQMIKDNRIQIFDVANYKTVLEVVTKRGIYEETLKGIEFEEFYSSRINNKNYIGRAYAYENIFGTK